MRLCRNLGIGGAVQVGIRAAVREGFDCAVQIDGDGQHPASELEKLGVEHTLELFDGKHGGVQYRYPPAIRELVVALGD